MKKTQVMNLLDEDLASWKSYEIGKGAIYLSYFCRGHKCPFVLDCLRCVSTVTEVHHQRPMNNDNYIDEPLQILFHNSWEDWKALINSDHVAVYDTLIEECGTKCDNYVPHLGLFNEQAKVC